MSQLLHQTTKLSSSSNGLCLSAFRRFSTAATGTPYLFCYGEKKSTTSDGAKLVDINLYDPRKDETVKMSDQTLPKELHPTPYTIGSSRGWVGTKSWLDDRVRLTNIFNPSASSHKVITLPPLGDIETHFSGLSLSASPDQQDCVVAALSTDKSKFMINLCRPGDSEWTKVKVPLGIEMMYSSRDEKFYLKRGRNVENESQIDSSSGFPQVSLYQSFPETESRKHQLSSTSNTQYLVESPSGESFIVYWCKDFASSEEDKGEFSTKKPKNFMVFRQDHEQKIGSYTEDIGDLCFFLGRNEAFCVSSTDYPGLKPNTIYYARSDSGVGFYDLSSSTFHELIHEAPISRTYMWLAPLQ